MELAAVTYYSHNRFFNSYLLLAMTLMKYFSQEVFKNDGTRVIYASPEYAFRQRLNLLNQNSNPDHTSLSLPFGAIYRSGNWDIDPQRHVASSMMYPIQSATAINDPIPGRFINAKTTFTGVLFFGREDDAQIAYETLMWIKYPDPKMIQIEGFSYKGQSLSIPATIQIKDIQYAPNTTEKEWLEGAKIIPISFTVEVASTILDQYRQGANSTLFSVYIDDELSEIYLTEEVILDFLSYFGNDRYVDEEGILLEVLSTLTPDPDLNGALDQERDGGGALVYYDDQVVITWTFGIQPDPGADPPEPGNQAEILALYEDDVRIVCSNGTSYEAPMVDGTYTITGLSPDSVYEISIFFLGKNGTITKYSIDGYTTPAGAPPNLKGMVGLTW